MKLAIQITTAGLTVDFWFFNLANEVYNPAASPDPAFETWSSGDYLDYRIAGSPVGGGRYEVVVPDLVAATRSWQFVARERVDSTLANDLPVYEGDNSLYLLDGIRARTDLIDSQSGVAPSGSVAIEADLIAGTNVRFEQAFTATDLDSTGWAALTFTVKADPATDDDDDALVAVRLSNPGDVADGVLRINGAAAADPAVGAIVVASVSPDTVLTVTLEAEALAIPPSPSGQPYIWELTRWIGDAKDRIGTGSFKVERTVRRSVFVP